MRAFLLPAVAITLLLTAACGAGSEDAAPERDGTTPTSQPSSEPTTEPTTAPVPAADPVIAQVPVEQWEAMVTAGMVRPGCPVTRRNQLRTLDINYVDFDGLVQRGQLVANVDTVDSLSRIFTQLFNQGFPIASMVSLENFQGDSNLSLQANNTAAFNCRRLDQINAPTMESPHANGRAVDINPLQNPWMDLRCSCWSPSSEYAARTPGPGKIFKGTAAHRLFIDEGWIWQNIKVADYMHFDTGYPSQPLPASAS